MKLEDFAKQRTFEDKDLNNFKDWLISVDEDIEADTTEDRWARLYDAFVEDDDFMDEDEEEDIL